MASLPGHPLPSVRRPPVRQKNAKITLFLSPREKVGWQPVRSASVLLMSRQNSSFDALLHASTKMTTRLPFKTTFEPERLIQPIFTGGSISLDNGARILVTSLGEDAVLTDLATGRQYARIEGVRLLSRCLLGCSISLTWSSMQDDEPISTLSCTLSNHPITSRRVLTRS